MNDAISALQKQQDGVVSRAQVLGLEGDDLLIERMLHRRRWTRVHEGVYVDHTGPLTWRQRAWAAVLVHAPSALAGASACIAHGLADEDDRPIQTVVAAGRRVDDPPGVRSRRASDYDDVVLDHLSPPRVRVEHAVLHAASAASTEDGAVARLAQAVQRRRTTPARLQTALARLSRLPRRRLLAEVLEDVTAGALSALERRYLRDVERAHGLPAGERQVREESDGKRVYRDVEYADQDALVELDGRLGHDDPEDRWNDLDRDIGAARSGRMTMRAGWRQVMSPCRLAIAVGSVLQARGWDGSIQPCGPGCRAGRRTDNGGTSAPDADDPPVSPSTAA